MQTLLGSIPKLRSLLSTTDLYLVPDEQTNQVFWKIAQDARHVTAEVPPRPDEFLSELRLLVANRNRAVIIHLVVLGALSV